MNRLATWLIGLSPLLVLAIGWQLIGNPESAFFPPPSDWYLAVSKSGWDVLLTSVLDTLERFAAGLLLGLLSGWSLGLLIGRVRIIDSMVSPTLEFLRATPAPALIPLIILVAGAGTTTVVVAVSLATLWPVLLNTIESARTVEPLLHDVARTLALGPLERVFKIVVPAVTPGAFVGLRVALPVALIVTLLAEMLTGSGGLGGELLTAQRTYATDTAYGLLVVAGALGVLLASGFRLIESRLERAWGVLPNN